MEKQIHYLGFETNMKGNVIPGTPLFILFNQPLTAFDNDSVLLIVGEDSSYAPQYRFTDPLHRKIVFNIKVLPDTKYSLFLPDSAATDWNGYHNKPVMLKFGSKALREYGAVTINLKPEKRGDYIFQLLNSKQEKLKVIPFENDTTFTLEYLNPGNYLFKVIFDRNRNGKWDTGNYLKKIEPEQVTYFKKKLNVRDNWELEETWEFNSDERNSLPVGK